MQANVHYCKHNVRLKQHLCCYCWFTFLTSKSIILLLDSHPAPRHHPLPLLLHAYWHAWWASAGSNPSPLFMERAHLRARLTHQKMLMIGGGSSGWGDGWPCLLEMAIFTLLLCCCCLFWATVVQPCSFSADYLEIYDTIAYIQKNNFCLHGD